MPRHAYVHLPARLVVMFSYKAGNTSLVEWLYEMLKPATPKGIIVKAKRSFLSSPCTSINPSLARALHCDHGFTLSALTRNPFSRAVSAYINKFVRDGSVWLGKKRTYERCAADFLARSPEMSFCEFLAEIRRRQQIGRPLNPHFAPQFYPPMAALYSSVHVLHLETIDADLARLATKLPVDLNFPPFPHSRSTERTSSSSSEMKSHVSCRTLAAQGVVPSTRSLLSPECIELVQQIYRQDFESFGYSLAPPGI